METNHHYATVSEALTELREKGYTLDFNLEQNCIVCHVGKFNPDEFEVTEVYRYEGNSDPADEATVYGIESASGVKGVLVTAYGMYEDSMSTELLQKLNSKKF
jgi:cytochrome c peroxidase